MKKITLVLLFLSASFISKAQFYASLMPGFYTGSGTVAQRSTFDVEFGKQWDVFSLGLDIGKINLAPKATPIDTTWYTEIRPNLNVFQQGKFTNTLTIGLGYIFGAHENVLTEFTTGIQYTPNPTISYNVYFGTYYFSGVNSASNQNFLGVSVMYFFKEAPKTGLLNKRP